jgi:outer membrane protein assembly factor BamB
MKLFVFILFATLLFMTESMAQRPQNWRGPERTGIYNEAGLMQEWPAAGPQMLWSYEKLGDGFTSPAFANGKIYITGLEGETGYLYVLSEKGHLENKFPYGPERSQGYPGSRSTPTITGNLAYIVSGLGGLVCMDTETGKIKWKKDLFRDFDGRNLQWGFVENLIVEGDRLFCSPGGGKYNIIALNRHNGELIWASPGAGGLSAYSSPLLVDHSGRQMLITMMAEHIVGVDAQTGKLLWSYPYANSRKIHPNVPIYYKGNVLAFSGYGKGAIKLKLNEQGTRATREWFSDDLDNQMGGTVLVDGFIYGSGDRNRDWFCVDWETGETVYSSRDIAKGTVIYADGRLYCYTERGELALVEPTADGFIIRGQADITLGSDQHWAHLVIDNGILYVRHGNALMAYNIKR